MQIAVWTAVYGAHSQNGISFNNTGSTLQSGNITFSGNDAAIGYAKTLLGALGTNSASGYWVDYATTGGSHAQYQLIYSKAISTPEPSTFAIEGTGQLWASWPTEFETAAGSS